MLLVHDLMLLLLDDEYGRQRAVTALPQLLAGALLVDLAAAGAVDITDDHSRRGRLVVPPGAHVPTEPMLAAAARTVGENSGKRPDSLLGRLGKGARERAVAELVDAGILREQKRKVLGLFPARRYPAVSSAYEDDLRARLTAVLAGQADPDGKTGPLIALLHAAGQLFRIVPITDRHQAKAVIKHVNDGAWAAASVRRAVQAAQTAAIAAATTAATTAGATGAITN